MQRTIPVLVFSLMFVGTSACSSGLFRSVNKFFKKGATKLGLVDEEIDTDLPSPVSQDFDAKGTVGKPWGTKLPLDWVTTVGFPEAAMLLYHHSFDPDFQRGFGKGFSLHVDDRIVEVSSTEMTYIAGSGYRFTLVPTGNTDEWKAEDSRYSESIFVVMSSPDRIEEQMPEGGKNIYHEYGDVYAIVEAEDRIGNTLYSIERDSSIDEILNVKDGYGDVLATFEWEDGFVTEIADAGGKVSFLYYDADDRLEEVERANGSKVTLTYLSEVSNLIGLSNDSGSKSMAAYYSNGLTRYFKMNGQRFDLTYGAKYIKLAHPSRSGAEVFNTNGTIAEVANEQGSSLFTWDAYKRLTKIETSYGRVTEFTYFKNSSDVETNLIETASYPNGMAVEYTYDSSDRLIKTKGVSPNETDYVEKEYTYGGDGLVASIEGRDGTYAYTRDTNGNVTQVSETVNSQTRTIYTATYDTEKRNVMSVTHNVAGTNATTTFTRGTKGEVLTITNPLGQVTTYADYNVYKVPTTMTDPQGRTIELEFDEENHIATRTVTSGENTYVNERTWQMNSQGMITEVNVEASKNATQKFVMNHTFGDDGRPLTKTMTTAPAPSLSVFDMNSPQGFTFKRHASVVPAED